MTRRYELKKRAERQEQTRQRIVEAAVQLHRTKGPARTSLSEVARLAGVQRHTLYRHFPEERDLLLACSGHFAEHEPPPDPEGWSGIADRDERIRSGLAALYSWYEQAEDMLIRVYRDSEVHPVVQEVRDLRGAEAMALIRASLAAGLPTDTRAQAALNLALDFRSWQRLTASGLSTPEAADLMAVAVVAA